MGWLASGFILGCIVLAISWKPAHDDETRVEVQENGDLLYKWYIPPRPQRLDFAGEPVPLQRPDIQEMMDREILYNYYNQYSTLYILRLSHRYFPRIQAILKEEGVPDDFKYLCVAESALRNQISSAGAVGYWQFLEATGKERGLVINKDVDERYHIEKATRAACAYLKDAYARFGSWTAAAASYNCGMGGYSRFSRFQGTENYYDLLLPEETMRYIFRILTFKYLMENAATLGFIVPEEKGLQPRKFREVVVDQSIDNLAEFARAQGTNYRMLKLQNPWLRSHSLRVSPGQQFIVQIPITQP